MDYWEKLNSPTPAEVCNEWEKGVDFNNQIKLQETVEANENFFIGKQWEGVQANGLPTPVFNFLKRVVLFQVASILSDNIKMQATPLAVAPDQRLVEQIAEVVSGEFDSLFEHNRIGFLLREYMRNAAVDGDGCLYTYWDPDARTGRETPGAIVTEVLDNTRVYFGNPHDRRVQHQPWIIIETREQLHSVKNRAEENGESTDGIKPDTDNRKGLAQLSDDRVTVLLKLWKDKDGAVWAYECCRDAVIRKPWSLKINLYPITWLNWDYVPECYHGMAMITGLIPNQIFVNKTFAMVQMSLMQSAFPKTVYDKTRIGKWTNQVGAAIGINGGDVTGVAKIIEPAQISPQVSQFIDSTINYTQTFLGATSAAMGDTRPDNTSAIIALQRASAVPSEITKQNLYQSIEDLGRIYMEFMGEYYGTRLVKAPPPNLSGLPIDPAVAEAKSIEFDFSTLKEYPMSLKLDVGASSYWSEIASMQSLDNLLINGQISLEDYLERVPSGYIPKKQELIEKTRRAAVQAQGAGLGPSAPQGEQSPELPMTAGNSALQRKIVQGEDVM